VEQEVKEWPGKRKAKLMNCGNRKNFRRDFLSNISHEFKTPLFAIQGYIEAIQDDNFEDTGSWLRTF